MLIKEKDKNQSQLNYLNDLLERDIEESQRLTVQRTLNELQANDDFFSVINLLNKEFENKKGWALIHDLRLEQGGEQLQIDHLIINRRMQVLLLNTKYYESGISITDEGQASCLLGDKVVSVSSPITQNNKIIRLLTMLIKQQCLTPKRLGVEIKPEFSDYILIAEKSALNKPQKGLLDCSSLMTLNQFLSEFKNKELAYQNSNNSLLSIEKEISDQTLSVFAEKLCLLHQPLDKRFIDDFCVNELGAAPLCPKCHQEMVKRQVKKGKNTGNEFWGCQQYPTCDGSLAVSKVADIVQKETLNECVPDCPKCKKSMVKRVSKKEETSGKSFWGCVDYPKCKATINIDQEGQKALSVPVCPECQSLMVKRKSTKGKIIGEEFWGCSRFPKCRSVIKIK